MTPLTCRLCGDEVVIFDDESGLYESHRDGADHAPDVERLGSISDVAEREGVGIAEVIQWQAAGRYVFARAEGKSDWLVYRP